MSVSECVSLSALVHPAVVGQGVFWSRREDSRRQGDVEEQMFGVVVCWVVLWDELARLCAEGVRSFLSHVWERRGWFGYLVYLGGQVFFVLSCVL